MFSKMQAIGVEVNKISEIERRMKRMESKLDVVVDMMCTKQNFIKKNVNQA